jgi:hemolysin D
MSAAILTLPTRQKLDAKALDFAPQILAIQDKPPSPLPRAMLYSLMVLFALLFTWALIGKLDIVATAEGKLVPQSYLKIVQPAEGGIVTEILVKEGDKVTQGQVLMRMDGKLSAADTRIVTGEVKQRELQLRRIDAQLQNRVLEPKPTDDPALFRQIEAQYQSNLQAYQDALAQERAVMTKAIEELRAAQQVRSKLAQLLPSYQEQESAWNKLGSEGFAGRLMVQEKQRERIETEQNLKAQAFTVESLRATIAQSDKRAAQITSNYRQQLQTERVQTQAELSKLKEELAKQEHKNALLELKASQAGILKEVATHTVGTVVSPGTILMTLVPINEPLQAEVMVKNEDVGFVREGQKVKIKLAAYPFQKYGMVEGEVIHIGADAAETQSASKTKPGTTEQEQNTLTSPYKAIVKLAAQQLTSQDRAFELTPGMQVVAEVNQGRRTIMEYLLSPVQGTFQEAARER